MGIVSGSSRILGGIRHRELKSILVKSVPSWMGCELVELQASHIQHIDHGSEVEMGGNVGDDDEEDSSILDVVDLALRRPW